MQVHSLKLLSAHCLVFSPKDQTLFSETVIDGMMQRYNRPEVIMAQIMLNGEERNYSLTDVPSADKLEKFVEDVKFGVYPLTALGGKKPPHFRSRAASPERADSVKSATPEPVDIESRRIVNMMCTVKKIKEDSSDISMTILLRMDDKMNRQLTCQVSEEDNAVDLTNELVRLGFVHVDDQDKIQTLLEETLRGSFATAFEYGGQPLTFSATINDQNPNGSSVVSSTTNTNETASKSSASATGGADGTASMSSVLNRNWSVADKPAQMQQQHHQGLVISPQTSAATLNANIVYEQHQMPQMQSNPQNVQQLPTTANQYHQQDLSQINLNPNAASHTNTFSPSSSSASASAPLN